MQRYAATSGQKVEELAQIQNKAQKWHRISADLIPCQRNNLGQVGF